MKTLHIIRHAKTHQHSETGKDFDRCLMDKGIAQANVLGNYIQANKINLGEVHCSSAQRTKQTCGIVKQQLSGFEKMVISDELYHANPTDILQLLAELSCPIATIIGHNNGISDLVSYLAEEYIELKTSELITLTFPFDDWNLLSRGTGIIESRYRPEVFLPD